VTKEKRLGNTPYIFIGLLCNNDEMRIKTEERLISGDKRKKIR
jgi:hypothetical protein